MTDRRAYALAVRAAMGETSHLWSVCIGLGSGIAAWIVRSLTRGDVGTPELIDLGVAVVVGSGLEFLKHRASRLDASYEVYRDLAAKSEAAHRELSDQLRASGEEKARLQDQVKALNAVLEDRRDHQAVADALTEEHEYGIRTFMHTDFESLGAIDAERDEAFRRWERDVAAWTTRLLDRMRALGCTRQEIHAVETFGGWPFIPFHLLHHWSNAKSLVKFRLDRLAEVSTARAARAEARIAS